MPLRRLSSGGGWSRRSAAASLARDTTVGGVCRGMQPVNAHAGGALLQRLPDRVGHHGHSALLRRPSRQ
ncbi:gamma-glutamyl-gamma-aminobutyrate hydrolase family protein [Streptomyces abikoensis]|uniref:Gamma-glutamyl-gamma-aminobutyrate hydrolase family protein n=1 Tax=Streptomyces abikoensis TaxID=97398 RepID=A0ABW7TDB0_9ACTN